jgi:hypothetical protein
MGIENNQITDKYSFLVNLKDKPTNLPKGKTQFRGIVFRKNTKIFDEVFLIDEGEYTEVLNSCEEKQRVLNNIVNDAWGPSFFEKVGDKLKRKYGNNWHEGVWYEYSVFDLEENRWGDIIHFWGAK